MCKYIYYDHLLARHLSSGHFYAAVRGNKDHHWIDEDTVCSTLASCKHFLSEQEKCEKLKPWLKDNPFVGIVKITTQIEFVEGEPL